MKIFEYKHVIELVIGLFIVLMGCWLGLEAIHPIFIEIADRKEDRMMLLAWNGWFCLYVGGIMVRHSKGDE